jgi:predicted dehydrogenase
LIGKALNQGVFPLKYQFSFLNPGHFHAALVLREAADRISDAILVYADRGPELDAFMNLVNAFNARAAKPTQWNVEVRSGGIARLISDKNTDVAVLAGRNHNKLENIATLIEAGIHVLADKPWLTDSAQTSLVARTLNGPGFVKDIMTIRHEILSRLCHEVVHTESVFGGLAVSTPQRPAIELGSIHHLYKQVNGSALRRPIWYFDSTQQGDGVVDIQSHLIEQAMWFVANDAPVSDADVQLHSARRWSTPVDLDLFTEITGETRYPDSIQGDLDTQGVLQYPCNGEIVWSLNGTTICQQAEWRAREPAGGGDMHRVVLRGNASEVHVEQGPDTDYAAHVLLKPVNPDEIDNLLARANSELLRWKQRFPGLQLERIDNALRLNAPADLDDGHESHFPLVRDRYLDVIDSGNGDDADYSRIGARYRLIAAARTLALDGSVK